MPFSFDRALNARVATRADGRCIAVEQVGNAPSGPTEAGAPVRADARARSNAVEVAADYVQTLAPRLGLRRLDARARETFQDARLLVEGPCVRLESEFECRSRLDARRLVQVAFVQTARGVPVWRSGITVDLVRSKDRLRVAGLRNTVGHDEWDLDALPLAELPGGLSPDELDDAERFRSVLRANTVRGGGWSESAHLMVHGTGFRIFRPTLGDGRGSRADFPLRLVAARVPTPSRFLVTVEVAFTLSVEERPPRSWRALVDAESGSILTLEPLSAHACARAMVLRADPVTLDGAAFDLGPCAENEAIQPLLDEVELSGLSDWSDGSGFLRSHLIAIRDGERLVETAPRTRRGDGDGDGGGGGDTALRFLPRSLEFASVCAYYHLSRMFAFVEHMGIPLDALFDGRARPIQVEPRGEEGYVDAQAHPRLVGGQIAGVESFTFGDVANCFGQPAISNAVDVRLVWHEFSHAVLMDTLHQRYLGFAHSFGDSLAALWCDPGTRAADRFETFPWTALARRHLRLGAKWSWSAWRPTDDEEKLYEYEQILSTCMFRLYRVTGGDFGRPHLITSTREDSVRRAASHYVMNLLIRAMHQQGSARFSPMSMPEHFVRALQQADDASDGFEGFPPGTLRKVVDWSFERQGLEPKGPDVYFDDGRGGGYARIDGVQEAAAKLYDETPWLSPSVRCAPAPEAADPDPARHRGDHAKLLLFARIANRGPADAEAVTLRAYRAPIGVGVTWDDLELRHEEPLGTVGGAPREIGPISWRGGDAGCDELSVVLELTTPQDESTPSHARGQTPPLWNEVQAPLSLVVPFDNNLAWVARLRLPSPDGSYRHRFLVQNPLGHRARIVLVVEMPHELDIDGWRLDLPSREVVLEPGRRRMVSFVLRPGEHAPARKTAARIGVSGVAVTDESSRDEPRCAWPLGGFEIVLAPHDRG